jgi:hypothetical protein
VTAQEEACNSPPGASGTPNSVLMVERICQDERSRLGGVYFIGEYSYFQIFQAAGYVVLLMEYAHEVRVIPIDGRPHLPESVRQLNGDSRGRWDGHALVVDTTNFSPESFFMGSTENLHMTEASPVSMRIGQATAQRGRRREVCPLNSFV